MKSAPIKAIAFDFDGVILQSVDIKTRAFEQLFQKEPRALRKAIVRYHLRNGGVSRLIKIRYIYDHMLKRPLSRAEFQRLLRQFEDIVFDQILRASWVPGAETFLKKNHQRYRLYVVSGTPQGELRHIVKRRKMSAWFRGVYGSPRKKDELLRGLLKKARLTPRELLFVGDAQTDRDAARKVGCPFVFCRSSSTPRDRHTPLMASLKPLHTWVKRFSLT